MLQSELHELDEIKGLVTKGQQQGVLTFAEVADAVSEIDLEEGESKSYTASLSAPRSKSSRT